MNSINSTRLREILNYDSLTGIFTWKKSFHSPRIGKVAGTTIKRGYITVGIDKHIYRAHRLAWVYIYDVWPSIGIDHINGIKTDNRIANLREATTSENMQNQYKSSGKGLLGTTFDQGKWNSRIVVNGKYIHLGRFQTAEEAYQVYLEAKRKLHPFSNL